MSVILYKKGNQHTVNGIKCDFCIVNEFNYGHLLNCGWHYSPKDCYQEPDIVEQDKIEIPAEKPAEKSKTSIEQKQIVNTEKSSCAEISAEKPKKPDKGIKQMAKAAGIKRWHVKSNERLEKELKDIENVR